MAKFKYIKQILLIVLILSYIVNSQSSNAQRGKNGQANRQQNNKSNNARSNQNQNNRKQRENKASQRAQQTQRLNKNEKTKTQIQQIQKQAFQGQTTGSKNQKNSNPKPTQTIPTTNLTEVNNENQETAKFIKMNLQSEEEIHQRADSKRQSLIKLMFLIVFGLIVIIIVFLLKPCLSRSKTKQLQKQNTEIPISNNQMPSFNFQTFGQNDSHIQRIVIKQKETKVEIIKDRFLSQHEQGPTVVAAATPQQEQPKMNTPTFAQGSARKQM